jgi:hypothetical protein
LVYNLDKINIDAFFSVVDGTYLRSIVIAEDNVIHDASRYLGTYSKSDSGIPKTDLASAVQTSLGKADTALQPGDIASLNVTLTITSASGGTIDCTTQDILDALNANKKVYFTGEFNSVAFSAEATVIFRKGSPYLYAIQALVFQDATVGGSLFNIIVPWNNGTGTTFIFKQLTIPTIASDVGAVALDQGSANAGKVLKVGNNGVVTPEIPVEPYFVTYSTSDTTTWTCDKTFA